MKALRRSHTTSTASPSSPPDSNSPTSSSSWIHLRSLIVVVASSPAPDRGSLKSPWSRRKRKRVLTKQQWKSLFTPEGKLRDGGVKFLKKVRSGGIDPSIRAEVWPFLLGVYDLSSADAERLAMRTERRKEYENLRRRCRRLLKHRDDGVKEMKGIDDATNVESPNFNEGPETPDSEDVLSARPSILIEQGSFVSSNRDQSGISHVYVSASKSDNLEEDQSEISHVDASASKLDNLEEEDKSETYPNASAEEEESGITHVDASSVVGSESSAAESSSEEEIESVFTSAAEVDIETDPKHAKNACPEGGIPKSERTTEDFTTWQRIIRLDAIRANAEWIIYSPAQAAVSKEKAQECASSVGLKDYEHLEPCRIYHAARLVAILEAYALYDQEIGYCQGMSDLLSPILAVMEEDNEAFWCFVGFMRKARHNFRLDEVGIRRQLNTVSKIIKSKDSHLYRHLEKLQAEDCFFVYRMVVVLFRRELDFEQTLCLWEVMWADQAAIRAGIGKSAWGRIRLRAPPTDDLLLYASQHVSFRGGS